MGVVRFYLTSLRLIKGECHRLSVSPWVSCSHPKESGWITQALCCWARLKRCLLPALLKTTLHMPGIPSDRTTGQKQMLDWWIDFAKCVFFIKQLQRLWTLWHLRGIMMVVYCLFAQCEVCLRVCVGVWRWLFMMLWWNASWFCYKPVSQWGQIKPIYLCKYILPFPINQPLNKAG